MPCKIKITKCWHDPSETTGYAEVKLDGREITASWSTYELISGLYYDTWLETTKSQNKEIVKALTDINAIPKVRL